ncbi:MAG: ImuA family protein [Leisingera sp.]
MPTHLLARRRHKPRPALSPMEGIALEHGRVHEACGPARHSFALWLAAAAPGPVLWLAPPQGGRQLNPDGMAAFASPARFLFISAASTTDLLWTMEEALRSGAAALVVAELPEPPAMTPVRRLHLAAEAGGRFGPAPLGLLLTPGDGGAQGIESRWHLAPARYSTAHDALPGTSRAAPPACWTLQRLRARTLPPREWQVTRTASGGSLAACPAPAGPNTATPLLQGGSASPSTPLTPPQKAPAAATPS